DMTMLTEDIRPNGQISPVVLFEDKILDRRNRARACAKIGIEPLVEHYLGEDPLAYVVAMSQIDFIWASPPCQRFTALKTAPGAKGDAHLDLIAPTRELLRNSRIPYAIE